MHLPRCAMLHRIAPVANDDGWGERASPNPCLRGVSGDFPPTVDGARDARIERARAAIAAKPAERWTVGKLARVAGLSRAAFARRFAAEIGVTPLRYVATVRLRRAADLLAANDASLAAIAAEVGYATEFAMSRAFRRVFGEPPGAYRRRVRGDTLPNAPRCLAA